MMRCDKYGKKMTQMRQLWRQPVSRQFQELIIDQTLEHMLLSLPFRTHHTIFLYLGMEPPSRDYENTETAKKNREELAASKKKAKTLQDI